MNKHQNTKKCSLCRQPGHSKRTCENSVLARGRNTSSVVKILSTPAQSLHTVNLRSQSPSTSSLLDKVQLYKEKTVTKPHPETVDFAKLVRQANLHPPASSVTSSLPVQNSPALHSVSSQKSVFSVVPLIFSRFHGFFTKSFDTFCHRLKQSISRNLFRFAVLFLVLSLPFPALAYYQQVRHTSARVLDESTNGFLALQSSTLAALQSNVTQAESDLAQALLSFSHAATILEQEHQALQYVAGLIPMVGAEIKSRQSVLTAGHHLALGNTYFVKGIDEAAQTPNIALTDRLTIFKQHLQGAIPQYEAALASLQSVEPRVIPTEYQTSFHEFKLLFAVFIDDLHNFSELIDASEVIFGSDDFRRYLVVFQNHHELRPTGGFMGSYAIVDVQKGRILKIEIPPQGIYDVQGQLGVYLKSPVPLQINNPRFELQDANWWPSFPASADKIAWFYQHSRGTSVDGVIAVNASVLEKLLPIIGTLEAQESGLTLTADEDPLEQLQYEVEVGFDQTNNTPKAAVGELFQDMVDKFSRLSTVDVVRLLNIFYTALQEKDIQISVHDATAQKVLREYGWTGELAQTNPNQDYLLVVGANILGGKSDAKITQEIEHQALIKDDGRIIDTVLIRRTHTGTPGEQFYGAENPNYVRIYVPKGAKIIEAQGFTYPPEEAFVAPEKWYEDDADVARYETVQGVHRDSGTVFGESFGKTFFANWMITSPGTVSEAYIVYELPFRNLSQEKLSDPHPFRENLFPLAHKKTSDYTLIHQRQSGIVSSFSTRIIYESAWHPVWSSRDDIELADNGASFVGPLSTDVIIGVVAEKNNTN